MNGSAGSLSSVHRKAYLLGLALCLGTSGVITMLLLTGAVPPGTQVPEGVFQQVGYLFTGLVFLSSAWVFWRRGQVLAGFGSLPMDQRPAVILRECLLYAAICEASSILGLVYWILVGTHAARHAWGFILMTPALFLALVPRFDRWVQPPGA